LTGSAKKNYIPQSEFFISSAITLATWEIVCPTSNLH
jgi:hypothetical protein